VRYVAASDELFLLARDGGGTVRVLVTDRNGAPHRSYKVEGLADVVDVSPITSGPFAGQFGAVVSQPSTYARITLP
jgi:hypothetical protein